ncbi:O-antigen ligase family protein [Spirillospora sp. NBC_01491]|uniref:O-antigen ligase family protein n=1 Tax=Spirillospora sp. NBC_01491 TaxID=2976007 RepID=UPI002E35AEDA|nr:O-antigen ligase family protein [Spirillospora sp. NBC_01491]
MSGPPFPVREPAPAPGAVPANGAVPAPEAGPAGDGPAGPGLRAARFLRDRCVRGFRPSWTAAATVLAVCVPPGPADFGADFHITAGDVAGTLLVALAGLLVVAGRCTLPRGTALLFGPLTVALGLTTLCSQDIAASLPGFVRNAQIFVLVPVAVVAVVRDRRDVQVVCGAVLAAGLIESGYGLWQALTGTGASFEGRPVRAVGTFGAIDVMAMSTVAGYAMVIAVAFALVARGRARLAAVAAAAVPAAGLAAGLSRGSWVAVGIALLVMALLFDRMTALRTAACAAALTVALVGGLGWGSHTVADRTRSIAASVHAPDQSVGDRYSLWETAIAMWRDHPLTGVGVKNFAGFRDGYAPLQLSSGSETADNVNGYVRQPLLSPHNQYLLILSEQGILGLAAFCVLPAAVLYGLWRRRAVRDPLWLLGVGFMTWMVVDFLYSDLGGPSSVLASVMLGLACSRALPGPGRGTGVRPVPRRPVYVLPKPRRPVYVLPKPRRAAGDAGRGADDQR